jgi:plasmid stabilization system protein ParE
VARIELAPEVFDDFDRSLEHLSQFHQQEVAERVGEIVEAIQVLAHSPLIGRPLRAGMRELAIGAKSRGYVALYRFVPDLDTVFILAVRSQREAGYKRDS